MLTIAEDTPVIFLCVFARACSPIAACRQIFTECQSELPNPVWGFYPKHVCKAEVNMQEQHEHVHNLNLHANNVAAISTSRGILFSSNEMLQISLWKSTSCHKGRDVFRLHSLQREQKKKKTDLRDVKHVSWSCFRLFILPLAELSSKPVHITEFSSNAAGVKTKPPLLWFFTWTPPVWLIHETSIPHHILTPPPHTFFQHFLFFFSRSIPHMVHTHHELGH